MKANTILLLGAIGVAAYFIYRQSKKSAYAPDLLDANEMFGSLVAQGMSIKDANAAVQVKFPLFEAQ